MEMNLEDLIKEYDDIIIYYMDITDGKLIHAIENGFLFYVKENIENFDNQLIDVFKRLDRVLHIEDDFYEII